MRLDVRYSQYATILSHEGHTHMKTSVAKRSSIIQDEKIWPWLVPSHMELGFKIGPSFIG